MATDLAGFTVAVTADRRGDEQLVMLRRLGVDVVHAPAVRTVPIAGDERLRAATEALVATPPDVLVATTSLGVRGWLGLASSWGLDAPLLSALGRARVVARGPKAAGAVATAGLEVAWRAESGRLRELTDHLLAGGVDGARIAVQLDGGGSGGEAARLRAAGADVVELPVYRATLPERIEPVAQLVERCTAGTVDAITFTAAPAVTNLFEVADRRDRRDALRRALDTMVVACIGPVCADAARAAGVSAPLVPPAWRLGSLVRQVGDELDGRRQTFRAGGVGLVVQGAVVVVDGTPTRLTDRERAVFTALVRRQGAVAPRGALLREVWGGGDARALETVIGRLRAKLGPAGSALETIVRRGYRWAAEPSRGGAAAVT
ncbi:MAG TPA: uroporphyrinogen-III synthase [Acidimicrobiales bacterium]|nr:uroporphyrinogen-III synthase [Acidimicrobiales bacterium]